MKVLVTGGAGYIGSVLTSHLLQVGHRVRVLDALMFGGESLLGVYDHSDFEFVRADVREAEEVAPALEGVDAVIHLAAIVGEPACRMYAELARTTNLDATISLVDQAKREGVSRFVFTSTCSNYGISDISILAGEEMPLNPISLYSETKVEAEKYVVGAADDTFCASVLRLATAYGLSPRMRFDLLVNELVRDAVSRKWVVLYGPESWRPFVHVKDVARAFETVLEAPGDVISGSTFNVGADSENYQKVQLAELIKKHVPYADMEIMERKSDPRSYRVSFRKISEVLGFKTSRTVENGIVEISDAIATGVISEPFDPEYDNVSSPTTTS
jgi:nucleoside-diphosphate-sugar epimerase